MRWFDLSIIQHMSLLLSKIHLFWSSRRITDWEFSVLPRRIIHETQLGIKGRELAHLWTKKAMNLLIVNLTRCWHDTQVWHDGRGGRVRIVAHNILLMLLHICGCLDWFFVPRYFWVWVSWKLIVMVGCFKSPANSRNLTFICRPRIVNSVGNWRNSPHRRLTGRRWNSFTSDSPIFHSLFHQFCY